MGPKYKDCSTPKCPGTVSEEEVADQLMDGPWARVTPDGARDYSDQPTYCPKCKAKKAKGDQAC